MDIEIITGFLGAGKTTFLNQYLQALTGKTAVIENEFGDVGLDGELISAEVPVTEINAGCICCSLITDFCSGIKTIAQTYRPDRLLIEPSGVGKLSDIIKACQRVREKEKIDLHIEKLIVLVDITAFENYQDGFGEFYRDQIGYAKLILFSHIDEVTKAEKEQIIDLIRDINPDALLYDGDIRKLEPKELLELVSASGDSGDKLIAAGGSSTPGNKVFGSWSVCINRYISPEECELLIEELKSGQYGNILRVKGVLPVNESDALHIDITHSGSARKKIRWQWEGKLIIIGCDIQRDRLERLFQS